MEIHIIFINMSKKQHSREKKWVIFFTELMDQHASLKEICTLVTAAPSDTVQRHTALNDRRCKIFTKKQFPQVIFLPSLMDTFSIQYPSHCEKEENTQ